MDIEGRLQPNTRVGLIPDLLTRGTSGGSLPGPSRRRVPRPISFLIHGQRNEYGLVRLKDTQERVFVPNEGFHQVRAPAEGHFSIQSVTI